MIDHVDATAYLIIEGERPRSSYYGNSVRSAKVSGVRQSKPAKLVGDQLAVKVTVRLPKAAFDALSPEATIVVSEDMIQHPVVVDAVPTED